MPLIPKRKKSRTPQVAGSAGEIARQVQTGTTYKAGKTALAQIPRPQLDTETGSSTPVHVRELVPDLVTQYQRTLTYTRMRNDAGVDVSLRVVKAPVLGADFYVEPASNDPQDVMIAEFIEANLTEGMSAPFLSSLEDILNFFDDGYSVLEKVYENREWSSSGKGANTKQYTMLKKLGVRPPSTITEIIYDNNGGPKQIKQSAIQADGSTKDVVLDISKLVIFTFGKRAGDLTGKSILRTAYPHWFYKNHMYKIDAIQKERHGIGVPRGKLLPGHTANDKAILRNLLRNIRTNEEAFWIETPTIEISFAELTGNLVNVLESAEHHNSMIMLNVLAQFLVLGLSGGGGGGRAGATGADIFMKALKYVANSVAQSVNTYIIPELVVWNFPTNNFPKLKVRNIGETRDLQMFAAALGNLFAQSAITPDTLTENWIREVFDMPSKSVTQDSGIPVGAQAPGQPTGPVQAFDSGAGKLQTSQSNGSGGTNAANAANSGAATPGGRNGKGNVKITTGTGNVGKPPSAPQ